MMAVCEVLLPTSVANPSTLRLSSCAVLDGVRSWLMIMHGSLRWRRSTFLLNAQQVVQHAGGHVPHVGGALPQILVFDGGQGSGVALGNHVKGVFGVDLFLLDYPHDLVEQSAVFKHQQMRVENAAFLGAHAFAHPALHRENLLPRLHQRLLQPIDLFRQVLVRQLASGDAWAGPAQHQDFPTAYASRNRDAPETLFSFMLGVWHG